jgi:signal peptide peptidase SppA
MQSAHGSLSHAVAFAVNHPWAITSEWLPLIAGVLARHVADIDPDPAVVAAAIEHRAQRPGGRKPEAGGVAVIPMHGVIAPRMNLMSALSGGATFEGLSAQLRDAMALKPKAIVLDIDSPGGSVTRATEFAAEVRKARTTVPIIAQVNDLAGSAAYWIASQATDIVASPSALVGSIGVFTIYDDISAALERVGIKRDVIAAGKYKAEGVNGGPLSDDARAHRQALVDKAYARFLTDVSLGRGVSVDAVRSGYGEGRILTAEDALTAGMVTRLGTMTETLERFGIVPAAGDTDTLPAATAAATAQEPDQVTAQEQLAAHARDLRWLTRLQLEL